MVNFIRKLLLSCGFGKEERPENRTLYIGEQPIVEGYVPEKFPDNKIVSSKYTLWNFLPKNLFEQFQRIANFYFLCVGVIQLLIESPVSPATSILPLVFVISVTAVKQGYEDYLRHKADNEVNCRPAQVLRDGQIVTVESQDIRVGDIVRVQMNQGFPCDLVMLASHEDDGKCYITTANLDGETNLKTHYCVPETRELRTPEAHMNFSAKIECQQPIPDLYRFVGRITISSKNNLVRPLGPENVLLRGAKLKNTPFIYGCAIYTGQETKMALNSKFKKTKFSRVERMMNRFLCVFLIILVLEASICTGMKYYMSSLEKVVQQWYIPPESSITVRGGAQDFFAFLVLFNYIIPISLYVTIELQKFFGSMFFVQDRLLYDNTTNETAKANTSDLNEELGQVEYLFTDKTGTLTENDMVFRRCSINGTKYIDHGGMICVEPDIPGCQPDPVHILPVQIKDFLTVLSLCHTIRVDRHSQNESNEFAMFGLNNNNDVEKYEYQASSPDETAFVEACRRYGMIYHGVKNDFQVITFRGETMKYKLHHVLEFDATRKAMSVIIETEKGEIYLFTKGAESALIPRCTSGDIEKTLDHINEYAMLGLRTLVIARKEIDLKDYENVDKLISDAKQTLDNREEALASAYDALERDLEIIGATAVEDRLQDGVPQTIECLRNAGIKVWVLTGDKQETAVNISYSAGHFKEGMEEMYLTQIEDANICGGFISTLTDKVVRNGNRSPHVLIIDGISLTFALGDHREALLSLCQKCVAVLCCRMSPIQKAEVVRLVKMSKDRPVTAAIGDGANDCSMIQEADVGLGIFGKEGRQAVRCSDYAFGRFRFLVRVLLIHGHWFYHRLSLLVQYFFYKNLAFITAEVYYQFFDQFSAQSVYDSVYLIFYNITFTGLPILLYGLFEQHIPPTTLESQPKLYKNITRNADMSIKKFLEWSLVGVFHSAVAFFGVYLLFASGSNTPYDVPIREDGKAFGVFSFGTIVIIVCSVVVNAKLLLESYYLTGATVFGLCMTIFGNIALIFMYNAILWPQFLTDWQHMYWVVFEVLSEPIPWLTVILLVVFSLVPDFIKRTLNDTLYNRFYFTEKANRQILRSQRSEEVPLRSNEEPLIRESYTQYDY